MPLYISTCQPCSILHTQASTAACHVPACLPCSPNSSITPSRLISWPPPQIAQRASSPLLFAASPSCRTCCNPSDLAEKDVEPPHLGRCFIISPSSATRGRVSVQRFTPFIFRPAARHHQNSGGSHRCVHGPGHRCIAADQAKACMCVLSMDCRCWIACKSAWSLHLLPMFF
jgi:hypothetical protein